MSTILLPINPKYVELILNGTKKYEYRRTKPKKKIDKIIIYETSPTMKIVGEVEVTQTIELEKEKLWIETHLKSGIDKNFYDDYFKNKKSALAFKLGKFTIYETPKELKEFGIKHAPQSFVYLD